MDDMDFWHEYDQERRREQKKEKGIKNEFKKQLKGLINITGLFRWMDEGHDWLPLAIVAIKHTGEKKSGYGDKLTCRIDDKDFEHHLYLYTEHEEIRGLNHYYVWQTGYDDSYNGFLLFPIKNGKYLLVEYSC